jgi:DNA-binding LytR/AlgR family response regulator
MKIKCAIIDDEELAIDLLESYINKIENLILVEKCRSAVDAYNLLQKNKIDLLFLDIQMPMLSGIDFIKNLANPPKVIFTTAYSEYAIDGFELNAVDYLLKPISFERFFKAINKLQITQITNSIQNTDTPGNYDESFIYLKEDKIMMKVLLKDILYIESLKNYIKVVTFVKDVISYNTISSMEEKLPEHKFMRVHRSYIVAIDKIEAFSSTEIKIGKIQIPIGRNFKNEVLKKLNSSL